VSERKTSKKKQFAEKRGKNALKGTRCSVSGPIIRLNKVSNPSLKVQNQGKPGGGTLVIRKKGPKKRPPA